MSDIKLSKRLKTIADMVTPGHIICDVGCDHAHVAIYLVKNGLVPEAIAMDVHTGPLERAGQYISFHGLSGRIETRMSDGLKSLSEGEVDTVIIAGMGGKLIQAIMGEKIEKTRSFKELILGPQSEVPAFRAFLRQCGFQTVGEDLVLEGGKFYPLIKVRPAVASPAEVDSITIADCYGQFLLKDLHPVLLMYLKHEQRVVLGIIKEMGGSRLSKRNEERLEELHRKAAELADLILLW